jgi:two-component system, cell cycle response regulator DivK
VAEILVVDDNFDNQYIMLQMLRLHGYDVVGADNGVAALRALGNRVPDLVVMDLSMPELDGWAATRAIRQQPGLAHLPIIAVTSHVVPENMQRALEAGCDDVVTKPVDFELLVQKIAERLAAQQPQG